MKCMSVKPYHDSGHFHNQGIQEDILEDLFVRIITSLSPPVMVDDPFYFYVITFLSLCSNLKMVVICGRIVKVSSIEHLRETHIPACCRKYILKSNK
jgi:hypothetical protein